MARRHRQGHHTAMTVPDDDDRVQPLLDHQLRELVALSVDGQIAGPEGVQGEDAPMLAEVLALARELEYRDRPDRGAAPCLVSRVVITAPSLSMQYPYLQYTEYYTV